MSFTFFPGCSMEGTAHDYQSSTLAISQTLGLAMPEVPGWTCCGSTAAHQSDPLLALALPAKNLIAAAGMTVAVGCAACYNRLKTANHHIAHDTEARKQVAAVLGTAMETACILAGSWHYSVAMLGTPLWLPLCWFNAFLIMRKAMRIAD